MMLSCVMFSSPYCEHNFKNDEKKRGWLQSWAESKFLRCVLKWQHSQPDFTDHLSDWARASKPWGKYTLKTEQFPQDHTPLLPWIYSRWIVFLCPNWNTLQTALVYSGAGNNKFCHFTSCPLFQWRPLSNLPLNGDVCPCRFRIVLAEISSILCFHINAALILLGLSEWMITFVGTKELWNCFYVIFKDEECPVQITVCLIAFSVLTFTLRR